MSWAWKQELPTGMKFTLVTLSNFADMEEGTCYPGQARLGSMTGQHANTIAKHLAVLEEQGYLTRERRINAKGHRTSDRYRLHLDRVAPESLPTETGGRDSRSLTTPEAGPNHTPTLNPYPHPECGGTVREQPSVEPSVAATPLTLVADEDLPPAKDPFEEFWLLYPRVSRKGETRAAWKAAIKTTPPHVIIAGVRAHLPALATKLGPDGDYRRGAKTWLTDAAWNERIEKPAPAKRSDYDYWDRSAR